MSGLEDLLRDAYQDAAGTVTPGSIRGLGEPPARRFGPGQATRARRWGGLLAPLAAAAAVVAIVMAIVVVAAVALRPGSGPDPGQPGLSSASAAEPRFLITIPQGTSPPLQVRDEVTGALVARVSMPDPQLATGRRVEASAVATADGRHYLVAVYGNPCRSWLYQFQLNDRGQPSALRPLAALPTVGSELYDLTISANGQMIGYTTTGCAGAKAQPSYLAATNVRTGQTTRWTVPGGGVAGAVSLTANGGELCYSLQEYPSEVRVIPTSAAAGSAADRGRTVVHAARSSSSGWISFAAITPDGAAVYFASYPPDSPGVWTGQVRELNLATGRSHVVYAPAGQPGLVTADPLIRHLLLQIQGQRTSSSTPPPFKLASLNLATGKVTYLPNGWIGDNGAVITW